MSQSSRKSIKDKIARQIQDMKTPVPIDSDRRTGRQQLQSILAPDVVGIPTQEELEVETKPKVVLYLREGLKGATKNWTKYPNDIHDLCTERLNEYETVIYYKLWRESWGYGRNYCRIGYNKILKETPLRSLPTVRRSVIGLREKQFIIMALDDNNEPNITRAGTLYRTCTPFELISGQTEEGIAFEDIPATGVICETIVEGNTVSGNIVTENSDLTDSSQGDQGGVISGTMIPQITVEKSKENKAPGKGDLTDSSHADHLIKEDSLKDTLPLNIVIGFYRSIGQNKISKGKRESAEKVIEELLQDGFSMEDIQFAAEWTPANAKEELYDFSIIKHTIGQAIAAKAEVEKAAALRSAREEARRREQVDREAAEAERGKLEAVKASLSDGEREKLRQQAEDAIKASGEYKAAFITDALIEAKENEILRTK